MRRDFYLPSSPATLQALDRMECTMNMPSHLLMWGLLVPTSMSLFTLPVSLDTYKNLTPGFLLLSNYLLRSPDPFLLLPVTPPPPSRHDWDDQRNLHLAAFIVGLA